MIAAYIDEFIMFCAGLWMTLVGFGYLALSKTPLTSRGWCVISNGWGRC